ncbi:tape measure protein [Corynebacterium sp. TAE3-ERU2]|uniref:tape measure protein n=1 Tax=Corynebacterium sp. TAE3-ERU2 TaxID=2849497 RepID=UPI001C4824B4|nr:tape measure protein [Corynebacterium sp. TAE3-ERU2]MBV7302934.1 tape measure protein [Corynebacterium sp. TAE3-ERU2]
MAELGVGYISIVPSMKGARKTIAAELKGVEVEGDKTGKGLGSRISTGIGGVLKKSAVGVGAATGAAIGVGLTKGLGRLNGIEQAEAKLRGLGNSAQDVEGIMDNALASVKGTAFGLEEAATTAAAAVASGIKPGEQLEQVLKTVGDTATIAGTTMSEMGTIFGSVMARGKLQGDDMLQLTSRGVPVLQMLATELGKTSEEVSKMVSEGKIDFETFEKALRKGVGGSALEAGATVQGAMRNMGAAAGRLGATIAGPFFNQAAKGFGGVTDLLDSLNAKAKPTMQALDDWLKSPAAEQWAGRIQRAGLAVGEFARDVFDATAGSQSFTSAMESLWELVSSAAPAVVQLGSAVGKATAALGVSSWQLFATAVDASASVLNATAVPALELVASLADSNTTAVAALLGAWMAFKTLPSVLKPASSALVSLKSAMEPVKDFKEYAAATGREVSTLGASFMAMGSSSNTALATFGRAASSGSAKLEELAASHRRAAVAAQSQALAAKDMGATVDAMLRQMGHTGVASFATIGAAAKGAATGGVGLLRAGIGGLVTAMGGPLLAGITAVTMLLADQKAAAEATRRAQENITEATADGAVAQRELAAALAGTNGSLKDNEEAFDAASKIVTASMAEFVEMGSRQRSVVEKLDEATVGFDEAMSRIPGMLSDTGKAQVEVTREAKNLRESYEELEKQAAGLGIPMSKLNDVVAEGGPKYQHLMRNLRESGEAGDRAADQLQQAHDELRELQNIARNASPAFKAAAEGMEKLSDASASAGDHLSALESTMKALGLAPRDAEQAMMDAADAVDQLAGEITELVDTSAPAGDALFDMNGQLDPTNVNARRLAETMNGMREQLQNVAVEGGDTAQAFALMQPNLEQLQNQFGLTDDQMHQLLGTFGLMPDRISTLVALDGVDTSIQEIIQVAGALKDVPEGETVQVDALTEEAVAKLEQLGYKAEEVKGADGEVHAMTITAHTEDAQAKLEQFGWVAAELNNLNIDPKVVLNTEQVHVEAGNVKALLDGLNLEHPTPQASLLIGSLQANNQLALGELAVLAAQSPTPTADLNKVLLDAGVDQATIDLMGLDTASVTSKADLSKDDFQKKSDKVNEDLDKLDKKTAKPKIDPLTDQAHREIESVRKDIGSLRDRDINIRVHYSSIGRRPASGASTGGRYRQSGFARYAAGGYHDGYRLPHTGPGTEIEDGFTAIDRHGMAIARLDKDEWVINRRSSERYNKELAQINNGTFPKLPGYAEGGRAGLDRALAEAHSSHDMGARYLWGGIARDAADCSGFVGRVAWAAQGFDPDTSGRMGTTHTMLAGMWPGFSPGVHGPFVVGVNAAHMAATVDGIPVEAGDDVGGPSVGVGDGAFDPQFSQHYSLDDDAFSPPYSEQDPADEQWTRYTTDAGGSSSYSSAPDYHSEPQRWSDWVGEQIGEGAKKWIKSTSSAYISDTLGVFGLADEMPSYAKAGFQLRSAVKERDAKAAEERASSSRETAPATASESSLPSGHTSVPAGSGDTGVRYDPAAGAEQWAPVVADALHRTGRPSADSDRTIEQIRIESGGDPNAIGPDSADGNPRGLLQVKPAVFGANRDPDLPDDVTHPLANVVAAIRYASKRYGSLDQIWPTAAGYARGGWVDERNRRHESSDTQPAWLTPGEFVVSKDAANQHGSLLEAMNNGLVEQAPKIARDVTKASSRAVLSTTVSAAQSGAGMLATIPALAPAAAAGSAAIGAGGALLTEIGSDIAAEMVGSIADTGQRMLGAGVKTLRAKVPTITPAQIEPSRTIRQASPQSLPAATSRGSEVHLHYHVAEFSDAMRQSQAEWAQYSKALV